MVLTKKSWESCDASFSFRKIYADMYGPTTGDKVRLADTELFIEVETDLTSYGDEVKFGGGKVIRDGMGQSQVSRDGGAVDTVITNALIIDVSGIYKADLGLKRRAYPRNWQSRQSRYAGKCKHNYWPFHRSNCWRGAYSDSGWF